MGSRIKNCMLSKGEIYLVQEGMPAGDVCVCIVCICTYVCVCVYVCMHACMHVHVHMYIIMIIIITSPLTPVSLKDSS